VIKIFASDSAGEMILGADPNADLVTSDLQKIENSANVDVSNPTTTAEFQ
jgi:hypothetical protein